MMSGRWKESYDKIPGDIKKFLVKGLLVFAAWQLLYHLLLGPTRILDQPLDNITGRATAKALSLFYPGAHASTRWVKTLIIIDHKKALGISDPCNALEIYVLYISFLFCYPAVNKRRVLFALIGVPVIFIINVIRCCLLTWLNLAHKGWFDISHHYIFTSAMYLLVFYLWILFSKKPLAKDV